jgi:hypothetical protein
MFYFNSSMVESMHSGSVTASTVQNESMYLGFLYSSVLVVECGCTVGLRW